MSSEFLLRNNSILKTVLSYYTVSLYLQALPQPAQDSERKSERASPVVFLRAEGLVAEARVLHQRRVAQLRGVRARQAAPSWGWDVFN